MEYQFTQVRRSLDLTHSSLNPMGNFQNRKELKQIYVLEAQSTVATTSTTGSLHAFLRPSKPASKLKIYVKMLQSATQTH